MVFRGVVKPGDYPPPKRPQPPYGAIELEIMRGCTLRACFAASNYPGRRGFAGLVGLAFHQTLETAGQLMAGKGSAEEFARALGAAFDRTLENLKAARGPRDPEPTPQDDERERAGKARRALMQWAHWVWGKTRPGGRARVEVELTSRDGRFRGRVDLAERSETGGVVLIDYKAALREELPERYENQLRFYAWLWHEACNEWPAKGVIVYPLTGKTYEVALGPAECEALMREYRGLVDRAGRYPAEELARPGEVCKVCEYRPWCEPFWALRRKSPPAGPEFELGAEGTVLSEAAVQLANGAVIRLPPAVGRGLPPGERVRLLGFRLRGVGRERLAEPGAGAEIFIVEGRR